MKDRGEAERLPEVRLPRIGLMATDALRTVGLRAILSDGEVYEVVTVSPAPGWERGERMELLLVHAGDLSGMRPGSGAGVAEVLAVALRMRPALAVIVLGEGSDLDQIERVIGAGAKGYLSDTADERELRAAIEVVRDGSVWAPRKVMSRLLETAHRRVSLADAPAPRVRFTRREVEVLRLLVLGHPNRQIALALGVDEGTVKAHMGRLMRKAGVDNRTALSMRAIEREWI